jgi:hypothetical protein
VAIRATSLYVQNDDGEWIPASDQSSARSKRPVTPDSDADLPDGPCRAIQVATSGNYNLVLADDDDDDDDPVYLAAGVPVALAVRRVKTGGASDAGIVALY